jgi:hypothetical protein
MKYQQKEMGKFKFGANTMIDFSKRRQRALSPSLGFGNSLYDAGDNRPLFSPKVFKNYKSIYKQDWKKELRVLRDFRVSITF